MKRYSIADITIIAAMLAVAFFGGLVVGADRKEVESKNARKDQKVYGALAEIFGHTREVKRISQEIHKELVPDAYHGIEKKYNNAKDEDQPPSGYILTPAKKE